MSDTDPDETSRIIEFPARSSRTHAVPVGRSQTAQTRTAKCFPPPQKRPSLTNNSIRPPPSKYTMKQLSYEDILKMAQNNKQVGQPESKDKQPDETALDKAKSAERKRFSLLGHIPLKKKVPAVSVNDSIRTVTYSDQEALPMMKDDPAVTIRESGACSSHLPSTDTRHQVIAEPTALLSYPFGPIGSVLNAALQSSILRPVHVTLSLPAVAGMSTLPPRSPLPRETNFPEFLPPPPPLPASTISDTNSADSRKTPERQRHRVLPPPEVPDVDMDFIYKNSLTSLPVEDQLKWLDQVSLRLDYFAALYRYRDACRARFLAGLKKTKAAEQ